MQKTVKCFLVIEDANFKSPAYGVNPRIDRMSKTTPRLARGEVAVQVSLNLDTGLFTQFIPTVTADISASQIIEPTIEVEDAPPEADEDLGKVAIDRIDRRGEGLDGPGTD